MQVFFGWARRKKAVLETQYVEKRKAAEVEVHVILHAEDGKRRAHFASMDVVQQRITIKTKVFSRTNKWADPVFVEYDQVYRLAYQIGSYFHYKLENHKEN